MGVPNNFAGIYNAIDYAYGAPGSLGKNRPGSLQVGLGSGITGAATLTLAYSYTTNPDSTQLFPLNTNAPVFVGSGSNQETVTPTALSNATISAGNNTCGLTATFSNTHGIGDPISSATYGLMEAVNAAAAAGGGTVYVTASWASAGGTTAMITAANVLAIANVVIVDNRTGSSPVVTFSVTLTNANVKATNTAPTTILPTAPSNGMWDIVDMVVENKTAGVAYANGGALALYYGVDATGVLGSATIAATFFTSPTVAHVIRVAGALADTAASSILGKAVVLANPTADFITGTGTAIVKVSARLLTGL